MEQRSKNLGALFALAAAAGVYAEVTHHLQVGEPSAPVAPPVSFPARPEPASRSDLAAIEALGPPLERVAEASDDPWTQLVALRALPQSPYRKAWAAAVARVGAQLAQRAHAHDAGSAGSPAERYHGAWGAWLLDAGLAPDGELGAADDRVTPAQLVELGHLSFARDPSPDKWRTFAWQLDGAALVRLRSGNVTDPDDAFVRLRWAGLKQLDAAARESLAEWRAPSATRPERGASPDGPRHLADYYASGLHLARAVFRSVALGAGDAERSQALGHVAVLLERYEHERGAWAARVEREPERVAALAGALLYCARMANALLDANHTVRTPSEDVATDRVALRLRELTRDLAVASTHLMRLNAFQGVGTSQGRGREADYLLLDATGEALVARQRLEEAFSQR